MKSENLSNANLFFINIITKDLPSYRVIYEFIPIFGGHLQLHTQSSGKLTIYPLC